MLARIVLPLVLLLAVAPALAGEPSPGGTTTVECAKAPDQKYACYLPKAYTPAKEWPILYCFAPDARGDAFVTAYRDVCEERGWIVVGSLNSKNGPWEPIQAAIDAMKADTESRFSLAMGARYASGFSGGARVSFAFAGMFPDEVAGVIGIGAGLASGGSMPKKELLVWLMCGEEDMNRGEIEGLVPRLKEAGMTVESRLFPGGHTMAPKALMEEAVRFMDDSSVSRKQAVFLEAVAAANAEAEAGDAVAAWFRLEAAGAAWPEGAKKNEEYRDLVKHLARDAAVKNEIRAAEQLAKALDWIDRNSERIGKSDSVKAQAAKKLEDVESRFPGTRAEATAAQRRAALSPAD